MTKNQILEKARIILAPYGLTAELFENIFSVGVGGDERSYTPVLNISGPFPGYDILEKVSAEISNILPINRVTFQLADEAKPNP